MKRWFMWCAAGALAGLAASGGAGADGPLQPGSVAPDFTLPGTDGKTYKLSSFRGKKIVVIAWFPKAFTGG